jgi:diaminohydroxyphosphoribosylaminopyrimidine deaminase / 5-amino-6-(5-phosphoribosylamino)uracil reductase
VAAESGIDIALGVCAEEALELAWPFVVTTAFGRPFVLLKTATSLDGRFAPPSSSASAGPAYLTGPEARRDVHVMRRWCDVVLVGEGTARSDRPRLDGRLAGAGADSPAADPLPAVADTDASLESPWPGRPHLFFCGRRATREKVAAIEQAGGTVVPCDERLGHVDPAALVAACGRLGHHVLMVEGGPRLAAAFLESGVVDRWVHYTAPFVLGDGPRWPSWTMPAEARFTTTRVLACGPDTKAVYDRTPFAAARDRLAHDGRASSQIGGRQPEEASPLAIGESR